MKQILVYSDSISWGLIPGTRQRLPITKRWCGIMQTTLSSHGLNIQLAENCLNGRRSAWADPQKDGRNGSIGLAQLIEAHSPLNLVIILLGTNDFQAMHNADAAACSAAIASLIDIIRNAPIEPGMPVPDILIVCPPAINNPVGELAVKFTGAEIKSIKLPQELAKIAQSKSTYFFDANTVSRVSEIDGVHLDEQGQSCLGKALAEKLIKLKIFS